MRIHYIIITVIIIIIEFISCKEELLYIYDWPDIINRYANHSDRDMGLHGVDIPHWKTNFGAGKLINNYEYKTSQFSLFKIMYERAIRDPRRTLDPTLATSFLIPYDFGMDATFFETNGRMRRTNCPLSDEVITRLTKSSYFNKNHGFDHTIIFSVNQNMNYFLGAVKCQQLFMKCWNCTKVSIDEYMFIGKDRDAELKFRGINWHAIPFPSDFHYTSLPSSSSNILPWESDHERKTLISFVGNKRRFNHLATEIRTKLLEQCHLHNSSCVHGSYNHQTVTSPNQLSSNSIFCLQPPGDMPTRKSLFDAILSGCIPVLFHPLTGRYMYEWHWNLELWDKIAIHFDTQQENYDLLHNKVDFIQKLIDIYNKEKEGINRRQLLIRKEAFKLQYSITHIDDETKKEISPYYKDNEDAYDITMRNILQIHTNKKSHNRTTFYVECLQIQGSGKKMLQSADNCNSTNTIIDPYKPLSLIDHVMI